MVILGLLLLVGAVVLSLAVISSNTGAVETDLWGLTISNTSQALVFATGMITAAVGLLGVMMLLGGARRGRRLRRDRRALAREHRRLTRAEESRAAATEPAGEGPST